MMSGTCSDTLRAGPSPKCLAFEWRKQSSNAEHLNEGNNPGAQTRIVSSIQMLCVSPFYQPPRYPNAEHLDMTPTGLENFFPSWLKYQDSTYIEMIAFHCRKESWRSSPTQSRSFIKMLSIWMKDTIIQMLSIWMKETILAPRQGLYPLFKCSAFDRGIRAKINAVRNRGMCAPQATRQGDVCKQNATSRGRGMCANKTPQATQVGHCQQRDRGAHKHTTIKQRTQQFVQRMKHNGFVHGTLCWHLRVFWFVGGRVGGMAVSCGLWVQEEKNHFSCWSTSSYIGT